MKNIRWTLLGTLILAAPSFAQAERSSSAPMPLSPSSMGSPSSMSSGSSMGGSSMGGTTAGADSGSITNGASTESTTITSTSTTGIGPDGMSMEIEPGMETTELANTGGEPVLLSLLGLSMAMGAFALRRRVSA